MSSVVLPSPPPPTSSGSSEVTRRICADAAEIVPSHASVMLSMHWSSENETYLWLGGHSTVGGPCTTTGGVTSMTVTVPVHDAVRPSLSVHVSVTRVAPRPYGPAGSCVHVTGPPSGSNEPLSMLASARQVLSASTVTSRHSATGGFAATRKATSPIAQLGNEPGFGCGQPLITRRTNRALVAGKASTSAA